MADKAYLAFDLGAESGRSTLGIIRDGKLAFEEVNRFANSHVNLPTGLHWNLTNLYASMCEGLAQAAKKAADEQLQLVSLGVDTWGVDAALIGQSGQVLSWPFIYRDPRTVETMKQAFEKVGDKRIYEATGIQYMNINTLYQLLATYQAEPGLVDQAQRLLFIPDLMHYFFSGEAINESSIASTSQMVDPRTGTWATGLLEALGLPTHLFGPIAPSGTTVGQVRNGLADELRGGAGVKVVAPASHDTASAVVAVPADASTNWAYLSCGTWSLLGAELDEPVITDFAREAPFTNEGGYGGTIRFLQNIIGLWMVQECRRAWEKQGESYNYEQLTLMADKAEAFKTILNTRHEPFSLPDKMPEKIVDFARSTSQPVPASPGEMVRACLESLALTYRHTLSQLEQALDRQMDVLHIVGGGGRNALLCQMTADAIARPVVVGPYEGTAAGNVLVQAITEGQVADLAEAREIIKRSEPPKVFEPQQPKLWDDAYERFEQLFG